MSWPTARLGDAIDLLSGFAFDSNRFSEVDGIPVVRIRDVVPGYTSTFYSGDFDPAFLVHDGDLLIGMDGNFNRGEWSGGHALLNQRVCRITALSGKLDARYLYHFLPGALKTIEDQTSFATVKHLSVKTIREIRIPLPPLPEQRRIAAILDQANELRIKCDLALQRVDLLVRNEFLRVTRRFPRVRLLDVVTLRSGKFIPKPGLQVNGDVPVYGANGVIATHDEALFDEPVLLIGRVGASGAINRTSGRAWVSDNAYVVSWEGSVSDIDFLEASLRDARLDQFASKSAQPLLSQEKLARAEIGFGSSQAQIEFGAMARRASELRDHLFSHLTITDELFRSLQHRAFTEWL